MGILAPLFFAGLAGLALPLIFHLVRRIPRGRQEFSSLMFLSPTPPRLTRRSRLDQIALLLMRLAALSLLALAFTRPFLRESALLSLQDLPRRRVAILVDTSASMHRGTLWQQALQQVEKELEGLAPQDDLALYAFSDRLERLADFASNKGDNAGEAQANVPAAELVRPRIKELKLTWATSNLGLALRRVAEELDAAADVQQSLAEPQLVVISDFQKGSRVEALQGFEWPKRLQLIERRLETPKPTNAFAQLLASDEAAPDEVRVRLVNAADSTGDQFFVRWADASIAEAATKTAAKLDPRRAVEGETAVYVPPGQSRVVKLPRPPKLLADRLLLRGDEHEFDNTFYVVPPRKQEITLVYAGDEADNDPQAMRYYLKLATTGDPLREVQLPALNPQQPDAKLLEAMRGPLPPQLVVAVEAGSAEWQAALKTYVEQGGTLLFVPRDQKELASLPQLFDGLEISDATPRRGENDFALLGEIDFTHPLFAPFANPRYNDFTRIHFWNSRAVKLKTQPVKDEPMNPATPHVLARFDDGQPWILERSMGQGRILALTSGWQPDDSQFAVSTKFVPFVISLLDLACGTTQPLAGVVVNEPVPLPTLLADKRTTPLTVQTPDGQKLLLAVGETKFEQATMPGVYTAGSGTDELRFAVNLAEAESDTASLPKESLEQLGVRMGRDVTRAQELSHMRQQRDTELESRQQTWRWLLAGCVGVLILETWWSSRAARVERQSAEAVA